MFDYAKEVTSRGGQFKPFSHGAFLDQKPDMMTRGHCFGLTLVWLSRYVRDRKSAGVDALSNLSFTQASKDPAAIMVIRQIQNMATSSGMTGDMVKPGRTSASKEKARAFNAEIEAAFGPGHENIMNSVMKSLGVHHIQFYGVDSNGPDYTSVLLNQMDRMDSGLFTFGFYNHIVGAVKDQARGIYKFMDVNYGQAVWKNVAGGTPDGPFQSFVRGYFDDPSVRLDYSGNKIKGLICGASAPMG